MREGLQSTILRLYPDREQETELRQWVGACRWFWNYCVETNKTSYSETEKFVFGRALSAQLPKLKREDGQTWLASVSAIALANVPRRFDTALRKAIKDRKDPKIIKKDKAGFPKFHNKKEGYGSFYISGQEIKLIQAENKKPIGRIKIPKIGLVKVRGGRWPSGHIFGCTVKQENGNWFLSVRYQDLLPAIAEPTQEFIGIDLGLTSFVTTSDGIKVEAPQLLRKSEPRLVRLQRKFSRQDTKEQKGKLKRSNRQKKRQRNIATLHKKIANQRKDFHHKLSTTLITKAQVIGMESLNVKGMSRGRLAKSVHDAGWGFFTRMLEYKANWYGREIVKLGRFERSTGCCSQCGVIGPKLKLGIDTWTCDCGVTHDRDLEAANWIKTVVKEKVSRGTAEPAITHGESKPLPDKLSSGKPTRGTVKTKCYA